MNRFLSLAMRSTMPAIVLLTLGFARVARADFQFATDFDPSSSAFPLYNSGTYGYKFTVGNAPLEVTGLASAYHVYGNVRIYENGFSTDVADVTLTATQFATSPYGTSYTYETLATPVTLDANTTYDIVWDNIYYGQAFSYATSGISLNSDITLGSGISDYALDAHPTSDNVGVGSYFGPSLQVTSVPEPAALLSFGIGGIMSLVYVRQRRKMQAK